LTELSVQLWPGRIWLIFITFNTTCFLVLKKRTSDTWLAALLFLSDDRALCSNCRK